MTSPSPFHRGRLLDDAYDEYVDRVMQGEKIDIDSFCRGYPAVEHSLRGLLYADWILQQPHLYSGDAYTNWPNPGEEILGFRLLRLIGKGAFAQVYLSVDLESSSKPLVVMKLIPKGRGEADTLAELNHPNIVKVLALRECDSTGLCAIAMPYRGVSTVASVLLKGRARTRPCDRGSFLLEAIQKREWEWLVEATEEERDRPIAPETPDPVIVQSSWEQTVAHLGAQLADALQTVHENGSYHRDIKPTNVLLTGSGAPVLLDFNLAWSKNSWQDFAAGTLPYMAPEQLMVLQHEMKQKGRHLIRCGDERSDLYSLGALLLELLTFKHPFVKQTGSLSTDELIQRILHQQRQGANRPVGVSRGLWKALQRSLSFNPEKRFESAREMATALRRTYAPTPKPGMAWGWVAAMAPLLAVVHGLLFSEPSPASVAERARVCMVNGEWAQAEELIQDNLSPGTENGELRYLLGKAVLRQKKYAKAVGAFSRAEKQVSHGQLHALKAYCYIQLREDEKAIEESLLALESGLDNVAVHNNLGYAATQVRNRNLARKHLGLAIAQNPDSPQPYLNRALIELRRAFQDQTYVPEQGLKDIEDLYQQRKMTARSYKIGAALYRIAATRLPPGSSSRAQFCKQRNREWLKQTRDTKCGKSKETLREQACILPIPLASEE